MVCEGDMMWFVIYLFGFKVLDVRYESKTKSPLYQSHTKAETCDDAECGCNKEV